MDSSVVDGGRAEEECETADRKRDLQDLLRQEMDMHLTEGRASVQRNQERVNRITQLKEEIRLQETHRDSGQSHATSTADHEKLLERRRRLRETHERLIENELMKMERELQEEQMGGVEGEMSYLRRERHILVLQIEALRRENHQAYADLETQSRQHQQEINTLREESLQVFRAFREVLEEQRQMSERRYRNLLLDAIQDAVHLSSQNLQLQEEIQQLHDTSDPTREKEVTGKDQIELFLA
ncbi:polyamine-modulated factor 1-binding protein 1 [Sinocyclocheilus anshuiensis]|uniref:polyamine-modulated factor 1-binding protein 1 n=1 Tax=Sinocyclocheilus anshuiensis TaxID=1608454 RepID=UPI0007B94949|nr:PREDICTED: polyamine-modulated factor 1-binding protein 1-like [Sinocyclocheilus anshuiensis]